MNPLNWTLIDLVADASPGQLASRIDSQLSLHPLVSVGWTIHASFVSVICGSQVRMISHS